MIAIENFINMKIFTHIFVVETKKIVNEQNFKLQSIIISVHLMPNIKAKILPYQPLCIRRRSYQWGESEMENQEMQ
jgi:hypothetical protein